MSQLRTPLEIVRVSEWSKSFLRVQELCSKERQFIAALSREINSKVQIDELRDGLRITTTSWVGVVRLLDFELQIVPKLIGENLALAEMLEYTSGLDALVRNSSVRTLGESGASLFELVAMLLAEQCEKIVRIGISSDYREVEDNLPVLRGRLLAAKQVRERFAQLDRLECRYDEYLSNIAENQILLAALSVCARKVQHPGVSMRIRRLFTLFSEVCSIGNIDISLTKSAMVYNRGNEHYREGHALAWLILSALGIDDLWAVGSHQCFAFLIDMNVLFQNFIAKWLGQALRSTGFRVLEQRRDPAILWDADRDCSYTNLIPDVLVERCDEPGRYLPIDAKYKLYDERKLATGDIYQTFFYACAYGEQHVVLPTSVILYPASVHQNGQMRLHMRNSVGRASAQILSVPIHIPTVLSEARQGYGGQTTRRIIELVGDVFGVKAK